MTSVENLVEDCRRAASESQAVLAVKDVVERVTSEGVEGLSDKPGVRVLSCDANLTVAHVVIPGGLPKSLPHDHCMWCVIGMDQGQESNEFFRRSSGTLEESGGRVVEAGEVLALGPDVIHRVQNPLAHGSSSALHVYGGDLLTASRSMWTKPGWHEEPFDEGRATGASYVRD
jgi:predicted metal-dependent enzyme (double-stranded beta helix superfamily)